MGAYHQMGHDSLNLLNAEQLRGFRGAILSPVNYDEPGIESQISQHQTEDFEMILDPQIYYPNTERGRLPEWRYFPTDVDSADQASLSWWRNVLRSSGAASVMLRAPSSARRV